VRSGQYEDTSTPSMRLLLDDPEPKPETDNTPSANQPENRK